MYVCDCCGDAVGASLLSSQASPQSSHPGIWAQDMLVPLSHPSMGRIEAKQGLSAVLSFLAAHLANS